jgi:hypothetical protein
MLGLGKRPLACISIVRHCFVHYLEHTLQVSPAVPSRQPFCRIITWLEASWFGKWHARIDTREAGGGMDWVVICRHWKGVTGHWRVGVFTALIERSALMCA